MNLCRRQATPVTIAGSSGRWNLRLDARSHEQVFGDPAYGASALPLRTVVCAAYRLTRDIRRHGHILIIKAAIEYRAEAIDLYATRSLPAGVRHPAYPPRRASCRTVSQPPVFQLSAVFLESR